MAENSKKYLDPSAMSDQELLKIFKLAREQGAHFLIDFSDGKSTSNDLVTNHHESEEIASTTKPSEEIIQPTLENDLSHKGFTTCRNEQNKQNNTKPVLNNKRECSPNSRGNTPRRKANYKCFVCQMPFPTRNAYGLHHHAEHSGNGPSGGHKKFSCSICLKKFASPSTYLDHVLSHASPEEHKYKCPECDVRVASSKELYRHQLVHKGKRFACATCGQTFNYESDKKRHMKFHSDSKVFKCGSCNAAFATRYQLTRHAKIHVPKLLQMYQCSICKRKLSSKINLVKHYKVEHEDCKKYVCDQCGKAYMTKLSLQQHLSSHENKQFKCILCNRIFHRKPVLDVHMRSHTGEKPYKCNICGKDFSQTSSLSRHKKTQKDCGSLSL